MLKLSIIVNMYNTAKYMQKCMDSLLCQDILAEEYEIIFVDDCSPDNSLAMAKEYEGRSKSEEGGSMWPTIKVCHHEVNKGLAGGRNTGLDAAEGKYLCFVDPDDYIEKNSLKALLNQMEEERLDMLRFNYQKVDEECNLVADAPEETAFDYTPGVMNGKEFLANRLGVACYVWAYIYRTDFVRRTGIRFIEGIYFDDTPWLPRLLQRAERVNCNPVRHQYYLQRGGSMVHTVNHEAILRKVKGQMDLLKVIVTHRQETEFVCQGWYDRMIAHTVVNMLTSLSVCSYRDMMDSYIQMEQLGVFPLSNNQATSKTLRKIKLLNINPKIFLGLLRVKNF